MSRSPPRLLGDSVEGNARAAELLEAGDPARRFSEARARSVRAGVSERLHTASGRTRSRWARPLRPAVALLTFVAMPVAFAAIFRFEPQLRSAFEKTVELIQSPKRRTLVEPAPKQATAQRAPEANAERVAPAVSPAAEAHPQLASPPEPSSFEVEAPKPPRPRRELVEPSRLEANRRLRANALRPSVTELSAEGLSKDAEVLAPAEAPTSADEAPRLDFSSIVTAAVQADSTVAQTPEIPRPPSARIREASKSAPAWRSSAPVAAGGVAAAAAADGAMQREAELLKTALQQKGAPARCLKTLESYDSRFPQGIFRAEVLLLRVESFLALGQEAQALHQLRARAAVIFQGLPRGVELKRLWWELSARNGQCSQVAGQLEASIQAGAREPNFEEALWTRAVCRAQAGSTDEAQEDLRMYLRLFPDGRFASQAKSGL